MSRLMEIMKDEDDFTASRRAFWSRLSRLDKQDSSARHATLPGLVTDLTATRCSQARNIAEDSSLGRLVRRLAGAEEEDEWTAIINVIELFLLDATDRQVVQDERPFTMFVETILFSVKPWSASRSAYDCERLLRKFLDKGCSPFKFFCPRAHNELCRDRSCRTLAEFAAFHNHVPMWDLIVDCNARLSERPHDQKLMIILLEPCPCPHADVKMSDLAESLFKSGFCFTDREASGTALRSILSHVDKEFSKELLAVFTRYGAFQGICPLSGFIQTIGKDDRCADHDGLAIAEILLAQDKGLALNRREDGVDVPDCFFVYHPGSEYLMYLDLRYKHHLVQYLTRYSGITVSDVSERVVLHAHRYVLDVLTKRMVSNELPSPKYGTYRSRVFAALFIRVAFDLPDITVDNRNLILWLSSPVGPGSVDAHVLDHDARCINLLVGQMGGVNDKDQITAVFTVCRRMTSTQR
ncbi:hypothetical protein LTR56_005559 [Elasticomyces elasticus]|nr:hypothetical protein LTR22_017146 [Elasticomyces elasticus]KAK3651751.1 hypothetical protein LTR56_005559 [Elasticomyces elasticus]